MQQHEVDKEQEELGDHAAYYGFDVLADNIKQATPFPPSLNNAPIVLDTDCGSDPDDAFAIVVAAKSPHLALVLTTDEINGERARFVRQLLDLLGRPDVLVVSGAELRQDDKYFCVGDLISNDVARLPTDVVKAVEELAARYPDTPIRWVGMGPLSNLAQVLRENPELASSLVVTQMGGAINYRNPEKAEHNFRLDPAAANQVVKEAQEGRLQLLLVMSDTTFHSELEVSSSSTIYRRMQALASANKKNVGAPWAQLVKDHFDAWTKISGHPGTMMHDVVALAAALEVPFLSFAQRAVELDAQARMKLVDADQVGPDRSLDLQLSEELDVTAFSSWCVEHLGLGNEAARDCRRGNEVTIRGAGSGGGGTSPSSKPHRPGTALFMEFPASGA